MGKGKVQKLGWSGKVWHFFEVSRTSVLLGCKDAKWQGRKALLLASVIFSPLRVPNAQFWLKVI
ncbi:MAG: hypothetical protein HC917_26585 [Richelia sp. SM2_1_7]|nr:hypothetical protein [Richelia sp. SM2_1_7]